MFISNEAEEEDIILGGWNPVIKYKGGTGKEFEGKFNHMTVPFAKNIHTSLQLFIVMQNLKFQANCSHNGSTQ